MTPLSHHCVVSYAILRFSSAATMGNRGGFLDTNVPSVQKTPEMIGTSKHLLVLTSVALLLAAMVGTLAFAKAPAKDGLTRVQVTIRSGDSLVGIAGRHGVSVKDLQKWNPKKTARPDKIRAGDSLTLHVAEDSALGMAKDQPSWVGFYDIKAGDSLSVVATRLGIAMDDLMRWNGIKDAAHIRAGDQLQFRKPGARPIAQSDGSPTRGKLSYGEHIGEGAGYRLRFPKNAFGIPRVLRVLRTCASQVERAFPGTAQVLIGDISRPTGGKFPPHQSHQTGRDADVGYYMAGNIQNKTMYRVGPSHVDMDKSWTLIKCYLTRDSVVRLYMDKSIQRAMRRHLLRKGLVSEALAERLFEEKSKSPSDALIRHAPNHDTHIHVRFACDPGDTSCREERRDSIFEF